MRVKHAPFAAGADTTRSGTGSGPLPTIKVSAMPAVVNDNTELLRSCSVGIYLSAAWKHALKNPMQLSLVGALSVSIRQLSGLKQTVQQAGNTLGTLTVAWGLHCRQCTSPSCWALTMRTTEAEHYPGAAARGGGMVSGW